MEALINIINTQTIDGESEKITVSVVGEFFSEENGFTVKYPELEGEMQGCNTEIKCEGKECVTVTRHGESYRSELIIENQKRHSCFYSTPHGEFTMGIFTKSIESNVSKNGGKLKFNYTIDFNVGLAAENIMEITIEPQRR